MDITKKKSPSPTQIIQPLTLKKKNNHPPPKKNLNSLKNQHPSPAKKINLSNLHDLERCHKNCACSLSTYNILFV